MMILTLTWIEKIFVNLWTNKKQDNRMGKKILSLTMVLLLAFSSAEAKESKIETLLDVFGYKTSYHKDAMQKFGMTEADIREFYQSFAPTEQMLEMFGLLDNFDELGNVFAQVKRELNDVAVFPLQREVKWTWTPAVRRYAAVNGTTIGAAADGDVLLGMSIMENLFSTTDLQAVMNLTMQEKFTAKTVSVPNTAYTAKLERLFAANGEVEQLKNAVRISMTLLGLNQDLLQKIMELTDSEFTVRAASIYMDMFTADEIDELTRLYQSPAGRKLVTSIKKRQSVVENMSMEDLLSGNVMNDLLCNPEDFASLCSPVMRKYQAAYPFLYANTMIRMKKSIEKLGR